MTEVLEHNKKVNKEEGKRWNRTICLYLTTFTATQWRQETPCHSAKGADSGGLAGAGVQSLVPISVCVLVSAPASHQRHTHAHSEHTGHCFPF